MKPYRESSAIIRLLSRDYGLLGGVVKGVYRSDKRSMQLRSTLQLGNLIELSWFGKHSLKTVRQLDMLEMATQSGSASFMCLSYVNELLLYLLKEDLPCREIFSIYQALIRRLYSNTDQLDLVLRHFEFDLLDALGLGLDFSVEAITGLPVEKNQYFHVIAGVGLDRRIDPDEYCHIGQHLLDIHNRDFNNDQTRRSSKLISRYLIDHCLEGKSLKSRHFYRQFLQ
jgi:DNA repair protein RecO (recombination protein O)